MVGPAASCWRWSWEKAEMILAGRSHCDLCTGPRTLQLLQWEPPLLNVAVLSPGKLWALCSVSHALEITELGSCYANVYCHDGKVLHLNSTYLSLEVNVHLERDCMQFSCLNQQFAWLCRYLMTRYRAKFIQTYITCCLLFFFFFFFVSKEFCYMFNRSLWMWIHTIQSTSS